MRRKRDWLDLLEVSRANTRWWFDEWLKASQENDELQEINEVLATTVRLQAAELSDLRAQLERGVCTFDGAVQQQNTTTEGIQ